MGHTNYTDQLIGSSPVVGDFGLLRYRCSVGTDPLCSEGVLENVPRVLCRVDAHMLSLEVRCTPGALCLLAPEHGEVEWEALESAGPCFCGM